MKKRKVPTINQNSPQNWAPPQNPYSVIVGVLVILYSVHTHANTRTTNAGRYILHIMKHTNFIFNPNSKTIIIYFNKQGIKIFWL